MWTQWLDFLGLNHLLYVIAGLQFLHSEMITVPTSLGYGVIRRIRWYIYIKDFSAMQPVILVVLRRFGAIKTHFGSGEDSLPIYLFLPWTWKSRLYRFPQGSRTQEGRPLIPGLHRYQGNASEHLRLTYLLWPSGSHPLDSWQNSWVSLKFNLPWYHLCWILVRTASHGALAT